MNKQVVHPKFGHGTIQSLEDEIIIIKFETHGVKKFVYPDAFFGYLSIDDENLVRLIRIDFEEKQAKIKAEQDKLISQIEAELERRKYIRTQRKKR